MRTHRDRAGWPWWFLIRIPVLLAFVYMFASVSIGFWNQKNFSRNIVLDGFDAEDFQIGVLIDGRFHGDELITIAPGASFTPAFRVSGIDAGDVDEVRYWLDGVEIEPGAPTTLPAGLRRPVQLLAQGRSELLDATFRKRCFLTDVEQEVSLQESLESDITVESGHSTSDNKED